MFGIKAPAWTDDAACVGIDPDLWHPLPGGATIKAAKAICASCPVVNECREFALDQEITNSETPYGIFGGLSANQRKKIIRERTTKQCRTPGCDVVIERRPSGPRYCPTCAAIRRGRLATTTTGSEEVAA